MIYKYFLMLMVKYNTSCFYVRIIKDLYFIVEDDKGGRITKLTAAETQTLRRRVCLFIVAPRIISPRRLLRTVYSHWRKDIILIKLMG
jgi:hypothetical protein